MTSNANDKRQDLLRKSLTGAALATGGAVMMAGGAQAQGANAPAGFEAATDLPNVDSVRTLTDGSVELTLTDGRVVVFDAADVAIVNGQVFIAEAAVDAVDLAVAAGAAGAGGGGAGIVLGVLGGGALIGAAAGGGGGGGDNTPAPTPNTNAPVFTSETTASVAENATGTVYTATATDADGNSISYSISGGADAADFSINASTGALTFVGSPDFEAPADADGDNVYEVTIRASDGVNTTEQTVSITVTDVDEAPEFTSGATATVAENATGTVYGAVAADPEGAAVTYTISGTDAALFTIDANSGALEFITPPDHENPGDADGDNVYEVTVTASDGTNNTSQDVSITVTDENEFSPAFSSGTAVSVNEGATGILHTVAATDGDGTAITYSIAGGADAALFSIDANTGEVTYTGGELDYENPGDANGDNVHELVIRASDGQLTTDQNVQITVSNVNEAPSITSAVTASRDENTSSAAYATVANDPDGDALTYTLSGDDAALFTIDANTGVVSFVTPPDFENPADSDGDNVYDITVTASDGTLSDSQDVAITVRAVNEFTPAFSSPATLSLNEGATGILYTAVATDGDGTAVTYSILGGADAALFSIDAVTGELTFTGGELDYENPADANGNNVYELEIGASDGELTGQHNVQITIDNVNEAPVMTTTDAVSVAENLAATVFTATATDPDGDALTYSLSGDDAALFTIDANTGEVTFVTAPDFESPADTNGDNIYDITVTASDGTLSDSQDVTVTVTATNDFAPAFTSGTTASVAEGVTATGYTAAATDGDGDTVTYSIAGGADAALFTIDANTGELSLVSAADFENPADAGADNVYNVIIRASDGTLTTDQAVAVTVTNVNEAPVISVASAVSIDENTTAVVTAGATDPDGDGLTYAISGADASLFTIDANTGALSFVAAPDHENPADAGGDNVYDVTVTVSDGTLTDSQAVSVTVDNVNDNAPAFTSGTTASFIENGTGTVYDANATDADGDSVTYSIAGGADAGLFSIDATTGFVTFDAPPDFEAPADAGADNVYDIIVRASDGTNTSDRSVAITVTDQAEVGAPSFQSAAAGTVSEAQTSAYVIQATGEEGDTITYSISGTDAALFSVDSETGEVTFNTTPDYENPADAGGDNVYDIIVSASNGTASASQNVSISVSDVTDGADVAGDDTTEIHMVSGGSYEGRLETAGDSDWIRVDLSAGHRYQINLTGIGGDELDDPLVRLYDSSGNLLVENDDIDLGNILDSQLGFSVTSSDTYYIEVYAFDGNGSTVDSRTGDYRVDVVETDPLTNYTYQEIADYLRGGFGGAQFNVSSGDQLTVNITALTADGQTLARAALDTWSDITGINFVETTGSAQITFDDDEDGAFAGPNSTTGGFINSSSVNISTNWLDTYGTSLDSYSFQTYIHEIGHALGLGHAGPYDGSATYGIDNIYLNDSWQATVMSYFSQGENTTIDASTAYVVGLQVADIIAARDMYGLSTTARAGDTTYGYNSNAGTIYDATNGFTYATTYTVYDAGGTDTFDYSGSGANQVLDLREEHFSDVRGLTGTLGIATGTVIENAIGGSGNDTLIGNDADNVLTGNGGADRFIASGGSDVFNGGSGNDTAVFSGASTDYTITTNGSGNTVVTDNRAGSPDGSVELISIESIVYDGGDLYPDFFSNEPDAGKMPVQTGYDVAGLPPTFGDGGAMPVMATLSDHDVADLAPGGQSFKLPVQTGLDLSGLSKWDGKGPVMESLGHDHDEGGKHHDHDHLYPDLGPNDWAERVPDTDIHDLSAASKWDGKAPVMERLGHDDHTDLVGKHDGHDHLYPDLGPNDWAERVPDTDIGDVSGMLGSDDAIEAAVLDELDMAAIGESLSEAADRAVATHVRGVLPLAFEPAEPGEALPDGISGIAVGGAFVLPEDGWL